MYTGGARNSIMFLRYEYANCRGFLLKIIKFQFTYDLVHKARFLTGCTASFYMSFLHTISTLGRLTDQTHKLLTVSRKKRFNGHQKSTKVVNHRLYYHPQFLKLLVRFKMYLLKDS